MQEDQKTSIIPKLEPPTGFWSRHRLSALLIISVVIAITMTTVSVFLYQKSGAAQLDLSRPGYRAVSDKVERTTDLDQYPAAGPVTPETVKEFIKQYKSRAEKTKSVDAFSGDPLNPEVLVFSNPEE